LSLFRKSDYVREAVRERQRRARIPTQMKTKKRKCAFCKKSAGYRVKRVWLCQEHFEHFIKTAKESHAAVFGKASELKKS
jgi:ribosomal protein L37AE/L43A